MLDWALYAGLLSALIIGFWQGRSYQKKRQATIEEPLNQHYIKGLNYILNEQSDAAIDAFVNALEINSETLETHLALGKMLRKKGEVDRSIRIHQNLLARPGLSLEHLHEAEYELATDFVKAGLLDRAENLLQNLVKAEGPFRRKGLESLLGIYRDEREWEKGLEILQQLAGSRFSKSYEQWSGLRSHFCCELAQMALDRRQIDSARAWLKQAAGFNRQSVRAALMLGKLDIADGEARRGIQGLLKIGDYAGDFLPYALPDLQQGFKQSNELKRYKQLLLDLDRERPNPAYQIALAELVVDTEGHRAAIQLLSNSVQNSPSAQGVETLLNLYLEATSGQTQKDLQALGQVLKQVISASYAYQCRHCGYEAQSLNWLCPSCKHWDTTYPRQ